MVHLDNEPVLVPVVAVRSSIQITFTEEKRCDPLSQPQLEISETKPRTRGYAERGSSVIWAQLGVVRFLIYQGEQCDLEEGQPRLGNP